MQAVVWPLPGWCGGGRSLAKLQKPAKNKIKKFVKLTDHTCYCRNRKWKLCEFAEPCMEKLVKSFWVN